MESFTFLLFTSIKWPSTDLNQQIAQFVEGLATNLKGHKIRLAVA